MKKHRPPTRKRKQSRPGVSLSTPAFTDADLNLVNYVDELIASGHNDDAVEMALSGVARKPGDWRFRFALGNALNAAGRHIESIPELEFALKHSRRESTPALAQGVRLLLASAFLALGRFNEGLQHADIGARLGAKPEVLRIRAVLLSAIGRHDEALKELRLAAEIDPYDQTALGYFLLRHGDLSGGFEALETRSCESIEEYQCTWPAELPTEGHVLIRSEEGIGDHVFFHRYVPLLVERGLTVTLEVPRKLARLMSDNGFRVVEKGDNLPTRDFDLPVISLPYVFGATFKNIPPPLRLEPSAERVGHWQQRLGPRTKPRIAIAWTGGDQTKFTGRFRSLPMEAVETILAKTGVQFVSIERYLDPAHQARLEGTYDFVHVGNEVSGDMADLAAVLSLADVLVTCENTSTHIAGAIGKPVWVMMSSFGGWRWHIGRSDSPWYPAARLFRQSNFGDWTAVASAISDEIAAKFPVGTRYVMNRPRRVADTLSTSSFLRS